MSALAVVGDTVFVGGIFRSINGQPRANLAALDRVSGRLLPWNPRVDADVVALAATNGVLYAGGRFDRVEGTARNGLAAFDAASGALAAWNPGLTGSRFAYDDGSVEPSQSARTRCTSRATSPARRGARAPASPRSISRPARRPRGRRA